MPDIHQATGCRSAAWWRPTPSAASSAGAIGFDINCGVRLLRTGLDADEIAPRLRDLVEALYATIPPASAPPPPWR